MAVNLSKGGRVNLSKEVPGLVSLSLGLGWDIRRTDGTDFDLDASALLVDSDRKAKGEAGFIFYNNRTSACGSVTHQGDNLTGEGSGDDEIIQIGINKIPPDIESIIIAVTIHDAENRNQNFGQVENAFIRIVNNVDGNELARYDLTEDYSTETALIFAELYRKNGEWRFAAIGDGFAGGLSAYLSSYGIAS